MTQQCNWRVFHFFDQTWNKQAKGKDAPSNWVTRNNENIRKTVYNIKKKLYTS